MTRRRALRDHSREQERVDTIMALGYYVKEFADTHFRIQDRVDFWPSTGKWSDREAAVGSVYRKPSESGGYLGLIAYLRENVTI